MFVKVITSLAGADFDYRYGQEVDQDVFAAHVGNGWESLCEPVAEKAVVEHVAETAVVPAPEEAAVVNPVVETTDEAPATERRGRRK